jgi:hypothetical protein
VAQHVSLKVGPELCGVVTLGTLHDLHVAAVGVLLLVGVEFKLVHLQYNQAEKD